MTTVLYHPATQTMYADCQVTSDGIVMGEQTKIYVSGQGHLIGLAGHLELKRRFIESIMCSRPFVAPDGLGVQAIVVDPSNYVTFYANSTDYTEEEAEVYVIGSGTQIAMGAYHATKDPVAAITAASKLDIYTGSKIEVIRLAPEENRYRKREYLCIQ